MQARRTLPRQHCTPAQGKATADASRDDKIPAQWAFLDFILGAKIQVKAQFGDSSNEIQALGLKKKSE